MKTAEIIDKLRSLMQLDYDAIMAYQQAIERIDVKAIQDQLTLFMGDHGRHVHDLKDAIESLGGDAPKDPGKDLKGILLEGLTAVRSMLGTASALRAMRRNEQLTNQAYEEALACELPPEVRSLIERNREDEARHLAYIVMALEQVEHAGAHPQP